MQPFPDPRPHRYLNGRRVPVFTPAGIAGWTLLTLVFAGAFWPAEPTVRADVVPPGCSGNGYGISLFVDKPLARVGDTLSYTLLLSNQDLPACQAEQIEAAITTPDGVSHPIPLRRTVLDPGQSDLYRDVISYVVRPQDIKTNRVWASSVSQAQINQSVTGVRSENYRDVSTPTVSPCLDLAATCAGGMGESGAITYSGTVRNCGDVTLNNVTVTTSLGGGTVLGPLSLAPGEQRSFSGSFVPPDPCVPTPVTLTAQAVDSIEPVRTWTDSVQVACQNTLTPGVALTAECGAQPGAAGQPLVYTGVVRNTGNVTLTDLVLVASQPAANTTVRTIARLAPGEAVNFTGSYPAPQACSSTVALTVNGRSLCGAPVSANNAVTCPVATNPAITLTTSCPATPPLPGGRLDYSGTVRNTGDVALLNIRVVSERNPGTPVFVLAGLTPGASANFNASLPVPAGVCSVTDTLTVTAENACGGANVANSVTRTCPVSVSPAIAVTAQCPPTLVTAGQPLTYTGTVRNLGNVALQKVSVVADLPAPDTVVFTLESLAAGAAANFSGTFPVPLDTCAVTYNLRASGTGLCRESPVTATTSATCQIATTAAVEIVSDCPAVAPPAGGTLSYTGKIRNPGNVALAGVQVTSDRAPGNQVVFSLESLAPGAEVGFAGSFTTPADACSVTETLTVTARNRCTSAGVSARATKTCPLTVGGTIELTVNCPPTPGVPGQLISYTGTVRNPSTVTLNNVQVVNDASPTTPVFNLSSLSPGQSANFNAQVRVPTNACTVTAAFTVSATDRCQTGVVRDSAAATCPVNNSPAIAVTHSCPSETPTAGATVTFSGTVRNTGTLTITNIVVVNAGTKALGPITLEPGQSAGFTSSYPVPADACTVTSTVTASGNAVCGSQTVTSTSTQNCPVRTNPALNLVVNCPATPVGAGGTLVYNGSVRNTGDVTLNEVVVNRAGGRVFGPVTLAPGAAAAFTAQTVAPGDTCAISENWAATARDRCTSAQVGDGTSTTCPVLVKPAVAISFACPSQPITPGSTARYSGTVRNAGDVTLIGVVVASSEAPTVPIFEVPTLAPGASAAFTDDVTAPLDRCSLTSGYIVSAGNQCTAARITESAAATCPIVTSPQLAVSHNCPATPGLSGAAVTFTGAVRNPGNVTLNNVTVLSSMAGTSPVFGPANLAPGQVAEFTGRYTIPADFTACTYRHTLTASGADRCTSAVVNATSSTDCPVSYTQGVVILSACPEQAVAPGQTLTYTASVQNTGTAVLRNIQVTDSQTGEQVIFRADSLAAGAARTFTGSFTVPPDCCNVTHTLAVMAEDACGANTVRDTSTSTCPVRFSPALAVTRQCPAPTVAPGDSLEFTGTVRNTGNVTLVDVTVRSVVQGQSIAVAGPIALAPGQTVSFRGSYLVPPDYCGNDELVATGYDLCGSQPATASLFTPCPTLTTPAIAVVMHCPTTPAPRNGTFVFTGTVSNTGNVTLTNVTVVNSMPTAGTPVIGPITLAPGTSRDFTGLHPIDAKCCWVVETLTALGQSVCTGQRVENSATAVCDVMYAPALTLTKECNGNAFNGVVQNTGNIVLTNVVVALGDGASATRLLGPIELAIGETATYSGTAAGDVAVIATGIPECDQSHAIVRATCSGAGGPEFTHIEVVEGGVLLRWTSIPGRTYRVQFTPAIAPAAWQDLPGDVLATGTTAGKGDAIGGQTRRFYRVVLLP